MIVRMLSVIDLKTCTAANKKSFELLDIYSSRLYIPTRFFYLHLSLLSTSGDRGAAGPACLKGRSIYRIKSTGKTVLKSTNRRYLQQNRHLDCDTREIFLYKLLNIKRGTENYDISYSNSLTM